MESKPAFLEIYIPLKSTAGGVGHFLWVKLDRLEPDTEARQFYCIVGLLAGWNESVSSLRADLRSSRLLIAWPLKVKQPEDTRTNTYLEKKKKKRQTGHIWTDINTDETHQIFS